VKVAARNASTKAWRSSVFIPRRVLASTQAKQSCGVPSGCTSAAPDPMQCVDTSTRARSRTVVPWGCESAAGRSEPRRQATRALVLRGTPEVTAGEVRRGVARTGNPRGQDADDVGRHAGPAGVTADGGHRSVFAVLGGRLADWARPNLLHDPKSMVKTKACGSRVRARSPCERSSSTVRTAVPKLPSPPAWQTAAATSTCSQGPNGASASMPSRSQKGVRTRER
jgi:hypothetical protein